MQPSIRKTTAGIPWSAFPPRYWEPSLVSWSACLQATTRRWPDGTGQLGPQSAHTQCSPLSVYTTQSCGMYTVLWSVSGICQQLAISKYGNAGLLPPQFPFSGGWVLCPLLCVSVERDPGCVAQVVSWLTASARLDQTTSMDRWCGCPPKMFVRGGDTVTATAVSFWSQSFLRLWVFPLFITRWGRSASTQPPTNLLHYIYCDIYDTISLIVVWIIFMHLKCVFFNNKCFLLGFLSMGATRFTSLYIACSSPKR